MLHKIVSIWLLKNKSYKRNKNGFESLVGVIWEDNICYLEDIKIKRIKISNSLFCEKRFIEQQTHLTPYGSKYFLHIAKFIKY